jgi:hypothetical protein
MSKNQLSGKLWQIPSASKIYINNRAIILYIPISLFCTCGLWFSSGAMWMPRVSSAWLTSTLLKALLIPWISFACKDPVHSSMLFYLRLPPDYWKSTWYQYVLSGTIDPLVVERLPSHLFTSCWIACIISSGVLLICRAWTNSESSRNA